MTILISYLPINSYIYDMKRCLLIPLAFLLLACTGGEKAVQYNGVTFLPLRAERLPDLPSPRSGHVLAPLGDGFIAAGGHTTGFVPVQEADIFREGRWTAIPMLYPHDNPFSVVLQDGRLVVGGGYAESFGIGQSWGVEAYSPGDGRFVPLPILERKRAKASALEMGGGRIVISGNWWADDATEEYSATGLAPVSMDRAHPYILRTDVNNAVIFGYLGNHGPVVNTRADRLRGEPFDVPILAQWRPVYKDNGSPQAQDCFTGDASTGLFSYLIHAKDSSGTSALLKVVGEHFSLLETSQPIPAEGPGGKIRYLSYPMVQRAAKTAWLTGVDESSHIVLAAVRYDVQPAQLTMYRTPAALEGIPGAPDDLLLPDGSIVLCGGHGISNYEPIAAVYKLSAVEGKTLPIGLPALILLVLACGGALLYYRRKKSPALPGEKAPAGMMERIDALMQEKELYRKGDLHLADLAHELGTNSTYVSVCINSQTGTGFPEYLSGWRIRYAQEQMRAHPERSLSEIAAEAGFANEKSFFRSFKKYVGMTPGEWRSS